MTDPIHWTQQRKRLGDLSPWPRNPRQIKLPQAKRLLESVQEFGQVETLATWEPSWEREPLFRPDLPRIGAPPVGYTVIKDEYAVISGAR